MRFEDATTIRLADPATRDALFDETALAQIASAAYDTDALSMQSPYAAAFDSVELGVSLPRLAEIDGAWQALGGGERRDLRLNVSGLGERGTIQINGLWRGRIIARTIPATGRIIDVAAERLDLSGIDSEINPLPADPDALETARRERVVARLRARFHTPDAADADLVERWLAAAKVASVSELIDGAARTAVAEAVQVTFSPPDGGPPTPMALPVTAALLTRDAGFAIAELLAESKEIRAQLLALGLGPPRDPSLPRRNDVVPVWLVPAALFDDADWPGAAAGLNAGQARTARRQAAGQWLAREGIGLVAVP
jgi:hypothetical protein